MHIIFGNFPQFITLVMDNIINSTAHCHKMKNEPYIAPSVKELEIKAEYIICQSDMPLNSVKSEGYEEEDFIW